MVNLLILQVANFNQSYLCNRHDCTPLPCVYSRLLVNLSNPQIAANQLQVTLRYDTDNMLAESKFCVLKNQAEIHGKSLKSCTEKLYCEKIFKIHHILN